MKNIQLGIRIGGLQGIDLHVTRQVVIQTGQVLAQALMVHRTLTEVPVHRVNQKSRVRRGDSSVCRQEHDDAHGFNVAGVDRAQRYRQ